MELYRKTYQKLALLQRERGHFEDSSQFHLCKSYWKSSASVAGSGESWEGCCAPPTHWDGKREEDPRALELIQRPPKLTLRKQN